MNYLINPEIKQKANEIIAKLNPEEKALSYLLLDKEIDAIKMELRKNLFNGSLETIEFVFNGQKKVLKLIRGQETTKEVVVKKIDYDKAINFAKEHNFNIPMTERIVIEPKPDLNKLEGEVWFQNNVGEFVTQIVDKKTTKSNDQIRITDIKE